MRTYILLALCALVSVAYSYPWGEEKDEGYGDEDSSYNGLFQVERRNWCARWGDFCRQDTKMKFAQCCPKLRCVCGTFWSHGKCICQGKSTFGR